MDRFRLFVPVYSKSAAIGKEWRALKHRAVINIFRGKEELEISNIDVLVTLKNESARFGATCPVTNRKGPARYEGRNTVLILGSWRPIVLL